MTLVKQAMSCRQFYIVLLLNALGGGISVSFVQTDSTLIATSVGVSPALAGIGMSALMIPGIFGRLIIGPLADRYGKRLMIIWISALSAATYAFAYFFMHDAVTVFIVLGLLGLYMMDDLTLVPPLYGDLFGRKNLPAIMGFLGMFSSILSGTLMLFLGEIFTATKTPNIPFVILGIGMLISIGFVFLLKPTKVEEANLAFKKLGKEKKPAKA